MKCSPNLQHPNSGNKLLGGRESKTLEADPAEGQVSTDGRSFWSGGSWAPAVSPDGLHRWNGRAWVPNPGQSFPSFPKSFSPANDIDDRSMVSGNAPERANSFPSDATYLDRHVAIGHGWIAFRSGLVGGWHLMATRHVQTVAVIPPSRTRQITFFRAPTMLRPAFAVQDRLGHVMKLNVLKVRDAVAAALVPQLPADTNVTDAARLFLSTHALPGDWGKRFVLWKPIR